MKLTKYKHACFTVEDEDNLLVVDPGSFATDFIAPENVVAVVVTHTHADHFDQEVIASIIDKNPDAVIVGTDEITSHIETFTTKTVAPGETLKVGPFSLAFFGGTHATIHSSIPPIKNIGVMVNDLLYYPGDSFTLPGKPVDTLALPASAPWMKASEAMDFLGLVNPRLAFPTHDAILSNEGKGIVDRLFTKVATSINTEYTRLEEPIEI